MIISIDAGKEFDQHPVVTQTLRKLGIERNFNLIKGV